MSLPTEVNSKPVTILKDEYKMVKKLGSGGFASVFLVSNQSDGRFMPPSTRRLETMMRSGVPGLRLPSSRRWSSHFP